MWRGKGVAANVDVMRQAVRALRIQFSGSRHLVLCIYPLTFEGAVQLVERVFREKGFEIVRDERNGRTLVPNVTSCIDELRAALKQKWRNCLNQPEKNNLDVLFGDVQEVFDRMVSMCREMSDRTLFADVSNIAYLRRS